jgi:hypothetical protein
MPVIPEELQCEVGPGKIEKPYLKKKLKAMRVQMWLK